MAAEFVPAVAEVCDGLGISEAAATVGISFGGLQAVHVAVDLGHLAPRLVLHSCAPSTLPYPDTRLEAAAGPLGFSPWTQGLTWRAIRGMTSSERGLRLMMSTLSTLPGRFVVAELDACGPRVGQGNLRGHGLRLGVRHGPAAGRAQPLLLPPGGSRVRFPAQPW